LIAERHGRAGGRPAGLAWALWTLVVLGLTATPWLNQLARQAGRSDLGSDANTVVYGLVAVSAATVGAVLASRRSRHPVGWLLLALGLWFTYGYDIWVLLAWRGAPSAVGVAVLDANVVAIPALIGFILLLTPTGSLPSPRWRWWARVAAVAPAVGVVSLVVGPFRESGREVANPLAVGALAGPLLIVRTVAFVVGGLAIPIGAWSLVVRFRRARGVERQQLRWLAVGAAPVAVAVAVLAVQALTGNEVDLNWLPGICLAILPLAIGAAILRYRLYDLDRIISRTVTYGLLTMLLGVGYAGVVLGLGRLLPQGSSLVVAGATLAVAAVFQPVRRRIQALVDRRFNRRGYDTAQTVAVFSARLHQEIDLDTLTGELLAVVEQTMQPTQTSLWLRQEEATRALAPPVHG
jgi:MFS family permease